MSIDPMAAYHSYSQAWSEKSDVDTRANLLARAWSDDGEFFDPETPGGLVGRDALIDYIVVTHAEIPGLRVTETSEPEILGRRLRVMWAARQGTQLMFTGTDFVEFAEDGRVSRLTMFYDSSPQE